MANTFTYLGTTYTDAEIISGSYSKSESLNLAELPVDTVEITVRPNLHPGFRTHENYPFITADNYEFETTEISPINGNFQQNMPLVQYKDGSQTAIWYMQSVERIGAEIYKMNGISSLGRLTQRTHYGGIYNGVQAQTILADIMGDIPYYVDNVFKTVLVYGWLPIATARDNLQQLLFALNANLRTDSTGTLRIENLYAQTIAAVIESEIYQSGANVKYGTPVTKVVVVEHQYVPGSETRQLFNSATASTQMVTWNEPMSNLTASSGLTIVESGANYAIVSGAGTLTGTPYIHITVEKSKNVSTANVDNVVRVENATLVGITASTDVVNRLAEYYACQNIINIAVASAFITTGDMADVFDPFDKIMRSAVIEKCTVNLSATPKSTISALIGFVPWQTEEFDDEHIVLTDSGTWSVPAGVTEITAILIGAGADGTNGTSGGSVSSSSGQYVYNSVVVPLSSTGSVSSSASSSGSSSAGNGGVGGVGGQGGKIYRVSVNTENVSTLAYACGASAASPETTFGTYSSESGASSDDGYYDPVDRITYGKKGADGEAGGNGGSGGSQGGGTSLSRGGYGVSDSSHTYKLQDYISNPNKIEQASVSASSAGGGGAGGASGTTAGGGGVSAYRQKGAADIDGLTGAAIGYSAKGGSGGDGANGANAEHYGCGGGGGGGGGGAGANGSVSVNGTFTFKNYGYSSDLTIKHRASAGGASSVLGGSGGRGGTGAPGCIILIYRRPS